MYANGSEQDWTGLNGFLFTIVRQCFCLGCYANGSDYDCTVMVLMAPVQKVKLQKVEWKKVERS